VLQMETIDSNAAAVIARLQGKLAARNAARKDGYVLAISVGAVRCEPDGACSFDQMLARADKEMYGHKHNGARTKPA
jgi:GGDEF domain-containing protein